MARTLYSRLAVDQAYGGNAVNYEKSADWSSAGSGSLVITGHTSGQSRVLIVFTPSQAHNAADWPTGSPLGSWSIDVTATSNTAAGSNNFLMYRATETGSAQRSGQSSTATASLSTTGIKTGTVDVNTLNGDASRAATDSILFQLAILGSSSHSSGSLTLDDSDTFVSLPDFTAPSTTPRVVDRQQRALQAVSRASVW